MNIIKKPAAITKKQNQKKSIDNIWPEIMEHVMSHPNVTNDHLFTMFAERCGEPEQNTFIRKCVFRGLKQIRNVALNKGEEKKTMQKSLQLTEEKLINFKKERQAKAIVHLNKMDVLLNRSHKAVNRESKALISGGKNAPSLSGHLDNLAKIQKVAKDVYNIDGESGGENSVKLNLAIINNFDPTSAVVQPQSSQQFTDI